MPQLPFKEMSRPAIIRWLLIAVMVVFGIRLFYLQVIKHADYAEMAAAEQIKPLTIPAKRGLIYAMDGSTPVPLVINQTLYTMFVDPSIVKDPSKILDTIRSVAGGNLQPNLESLISRKESRYQILGKNLTRRQAEMIKSKNYAGLGFQEVTARVYPEAGLAGQVLGFVNGDGVGQYGVEGYFNSQLVGKDGRLKSVTDPSGVPLTIGDKNVNIPAVDGDDIVLTIDRNVQAFAEKALAEGLKRTKATNGSVVVIDPRNGKVMAMANLPTYNPAEFGKAQSADLFNNAIVSAPYEPGSDIKTFTVATGLDKGIIEPDSRYNNTDYIKIEDRTIQNFTKGQTGDITYQTALNYSLNTGMVTIAKLLGDGNSITKGARDTLYDYFHNRFGFGKLTGIELSNEQPGIIISPSQRDGGAVRYSNMTFGQGMDLTMIQVASSFCSLVNGGTYYPPTVVEGKLDKDGNLVAAPKKTPKLGVISKTASDKVHKMIHEARTAFFANRDKPGYDIGGKTGTSQTLINGSYDNDQTVGTYLGYGGDTEAKYVIMVEVSGEGMGLQGGTDAMPIFTDISNWLIDYLKLQPKG